MNRVLRMLLGVKQAYTIAELQKPFVMARFVFRTDNNDKEVRRQLVDAHIRAMTGIYGPGSAIVVPEKTEPIGITPCPPEKEQENEGDQEASDPEPGTDSLSAEFRPEKLGNLFKHLSSMQDVLF